jgi:hypothetical protein
MFALHGWHALLTLDDSEGERTSASRDGASSATHMARHAVCPLDGGRDLPTRGQLAYPV